MERYAMDSDGPESWRDEYFVRRTFLPVQSFTSYYRFFAKLKPDDWKK